MKFARIGAVGHELPAVFPGFSPTGPWLVTKDDADYRNPRLRSIGRQRQTFVSANLG